MRAFVRFRCPDGSIAELAHGDLIGRLGTAALHLDDARISEAHAMISLRGEELKLLALRGRFAVGNKPLSGLTLAEGQRISFARGLTLTVEEVVLPDEVIALSVGGKPQILLGATAILIDGDGLRMQAGYREGAAALVWNRDERWRISIPGQPARDLIPGETHTVAGSPVTAVALPLSRLSGNATRLAGAISSPLCLLYTSPSPRDDR